MGFISSESSGNVVCIRSKRPPDNKPYTKNNNLKRFRLVSSGTYSNRKVDVKVHHSNDESRQVQVLIRGIQKGDRSKCFFLSCSNQDCAKLWANIINSMGSKDGGIDQKVPKYRVASIGSSVKMIETSISTNTEIQLLIPDVNGCRRLTFLRFDNQIDAYELVANLNRSMRHIALINRIKFTSN